MKEARKGRKIWKKLKKEFGIDYSKVVLVLPETDDDWNRQALFYLPDFIRRKSADRAIVISPWDKVLEEAEAINDPGVMISAKKLDLQEIEELLNYYLFYRFFDSIAFLYKDKPRDNPGTLILSQGCVSIRELICLGHYNLREVPQDV